MVGGGADGDGGTDARIFVVVSAAAVLASEVKARTARVPRFAVKYGLH
jgi:hypothetical protein